MSDAGVGNTRDLALLTKNKYNRLTIGKPNVNILKFINPLSPTRFIWESLSSVHVLKNLKNISYNRDLVYDGKKLS